MITLRHTTFGRTPLDEWSAQSRDLYLTTHNTHKRQTSMPLAGFEPTIPERERLQTHALDRAATGTGNFTFYLWLFTHLGPGSIVGMATAYGLDGPGIESRWGRDFPHLSRPALRPIHPPVKWVPGLSRGKVRPGRDADPSPPSSAEVKNKVELYLYSP